MSGDSGSPGVPATPAGSMAGVSRGMGRGSGPREAESVQAGLGPGLGFEDRSKAKTSSDGALGDSGARDSDGLLRCGESRKSLIINYLILLCR